MRIYLFLLCMACASSVGCVKRIEQAKPHRNPHLPGVYISLVSGVQVEQSGSKSATVCLSLHNNTCWDIRFFSFGPADSGYGEILAYKLVPADVMRVPRGDWPLSGKPPDLAFYTQTFHAGGYEILATGKSVEFWVPAEHLCGDLFIWVPFFYGWEPPIADEPNREPLHFVTFRGNCR